MSSSSLKSDLLDIDQLKKTMNMTGTPGPTLLQKITSEEVSRVSFSFFLSTYFTMLWPWINKQWKRNSSWEM